MIGILRLPDHGHDAAQRRPHARMHHRATQKSAELLLFSRFCNADRYGYRPAYRSLRRAMKATRW